MSSGSSPDTPSISTCPPPEGLYLSPDPIVTSGCNGVEQTHTYFVMEEVKESPLLPMPKAKDHR